MNNKKYVGLLVFVLAVFVMCFISYRLVAPKIKDVDSTKAVIAETQTTLDKKREERNIIIQKIAKLKQSVMSSQKKIYSPVEDYGDDKNDTLFFTLYSDVMEMLHANSIRIKSIDYKYNPSEDVFTKQGGMYFVCDVNMEIVSNYINLGKLIQDIYQYPYYIKINNLEVKPYPKDKKILLSKLSLRLYAHTDAENQLMEDESVGGEAIQGAETPLPQE